MKQAMTTGNSGGGGGGGGTVLYLTKHLHLSWRNTPDQLLVTPHPGCWRSGEGWRPRPPGGRRCYKNPRLPCTRQARGRAATGPLQERWSTRMRSRTPPVACWSNPECETIGIQSFSCSFKCAVCTGTTNKH